MAERPSVGKHVPPTGQRAEVLFSRSAIAAADVTLFVCLHRLRFVSAGIFYPRSAQVELFSEPLRSVLKVSGSFALCQPHANMYMYTHYKAFDLCAFVLLSCSLQYLPAYKRIYEHVSLRTSHQRKCLILRISFSWEFKEINNTYTHNNSSFMIPLSNVFLRWCVSDAKITIRAVVVATSGCVECISFSTVYTKVDSF